LKHARNHATIILKTDEGDGNMKRSFKGIISRIHASIWFKTIDTKRMEQEKTNYLIKFYR